MFEKFIGFAFLVAFAGAQQDHDPAASYISFKQTIGNFESGSSGKLGSGFSSSGLLSGGDEGSYVSYTQGFTGSLSQGQEEHHAHPKYSFKYGVEDKHTGDIKHQEETRDGDVVKGSYSVHEPDGTILVVHYTADKHSGYNAVVERQGHASHPQYSQH